MILLPHCLQADALNLVEISKRHVILIILVYIQLELCSQLAEIDVNAYTVERFRNNNQPKSMPNGSKRPGQGLTVVNRFIRKLNMPGTNF